MTITRLFNSPAVLTQTSDAEHEIPEPAIAVSHDASPILVISQEGRDILLNLESVNEFCRLLKSTRDRARSWEREREELKS